MARWYRQLYVRRRECDPKGIRDIWDFINAYCPLSSLESLVLVERYISGKGERELAKEIGVPWRRLNRATWRMKGKLRFCIHEYAKIRASNAAIV